MTKEMLTLANDDPVINPFETLSALLDQFTVRAELYQNARAAFAEHGEKVDLALAQHHAESFVGAAILASQLARVIEPECRMSYADPEAARIGRIGVDAVRDCRVATGQLILDLQSLTGLPLGAGDAECLAMMAEARASIEGVS